MFWRCTCGETIDIVKQIHCNHGKIKNDLFEGWKVYFNCEICNRESSMKLRKDEVGDLKNRVKYYSLPRTDFNWLTRLDIERYKVKEGDFISLDYAVFKTEVGHETLYGKFCGFSYDEKECLVIESMNTNNIHLSKIPVDHISKIEKIGKFVKNVRNK